MNDTTTDSNSSAPRRRRKSRKGLIFAIVVVLAGGGYYAWHKHQLDRNKEGEYLTATVTTGNIEDLVTSTGTLQPRDYVDVGAQVSGQIDQLLVEVGDVVTKGQDLVKIDATQAEARMEQSEIQLSTNRNSLETQRENLKKTERDFQRQKNLFAQDATTRQSVLDAETAFENAKRQIRASELSIQNQEASMRIDKKNLAYTTIKAPIDGTVMSIAVKLGQTVNASQNVPNVMRIANLETMTVQSEVSEADVAKLYKGIRVYFTTLGGNNRRWYGELKRIEPTPKVQNSVVLYNALFDVQNDGSTLMPSMTAQVFFVSAQAENVLLVPMAALTQGQQIERELRAKEREKNGGAAPARGPGGMPGAPGAAPGGPAAAETAAALPGASAAGAGSAPASATAATAPANGNVAANGPQGNRPSGNGNAQGNRPGANGQGATGQGMRTGQAGGGFNGQRPGGNGQAGAGGQRMGGFNGQSISPEQMEQFRRMRESGGFGNRQGGGFGNRQGGSFAATSGGAGGAPRQVQQRRGVVMVQKDDGTLEARQVVVGVTDRVHGQVISGLKEGEVVVVAKRETEAAAAPRNNNNQNQFQNNQNRGGNQGFPGGGNFQGGRPF